MFGFFNVTMSYCMANSDIRVPLSYLEISSFFSFSCCYYVFSLYSSLLALVCVRVWLRECVGACVRTSIFEFEDQRISISKN